MGSEPSVYGGPHCSPTGSGDFPGWRDAAENACGRTETILIPSHSLVIAAVAAATIVGPMLHRVSKRPERNQSSRWRYQAPTWSA